jgi:2-polyprenyl-3-methyl-5-hydroxy-6-metoxy-1,4-benzoquinol methylase
MIAGNATFDPPAAIEPAVGSEDWLAYNHGKRIGILIVAYNAVNTLAQVLRRVTPQVWQNVEEVAVFDDASPDATYALAVGLKTVNAMTKFHVVRNHQNLGYGGNQKTGYAYFAERGFDVVVLLHADGQYAPEILSHMYHPIVAGEAEAVLGSRLMRTYGGPLKGGMPLYKYVGNRILTSFENRALGMKLSEFHSGYRAYSLETLSHIDLTRMTDDFHFDTEIIIKLNHQGCRIKEVPIPTYYGTEICYVNGMKYAGNVARSVLRYKSTIRSVKKHPEFQEYFVHYPLKQSGYSSHYYFEQLTGVDQDVLDIGCGEGFMATRLAKRGNRLTGIDVLAEPKCPETFQDYVSADLSHGLGDAVTQLAGKLFDRILLMDVLEHLVRPEVLLHHCLGFLKPSGLLLVSVPNVANVTVRLALAFGNFNPTERGILDKTHLHFYTRKTARRLLDQNGFSVVREKTTVMPFELVLGLSARNPIMRLLTRVLGVLTATFPGLLGYQTILVGRARPVTQSKCEKP